MSNTSDTIGRNTIERGWIIAISVLAILLGLIVFLVPEATLFTVSILFGTYLVASGAFRLVAAFTSNRLPGWVRWLTALLGVLILVAGILCLSNPWQSLAVLGVVIGLGWIFDGVASIASRARRTDKFRWLPVSAGIAAIIAGILVMIMPILALASFIIVAAILLIVVGVATLFLLSVGPRTGSDAAGAAGSTAGSTAGSAEPATVTPHAADESEATATTSHDDAPARGDETT